MTLTVQAWADVACPLSYLCRGRLAEAIRRYHQAGGHHEVVVEYRSFELASDTPADYDGNEIDFLTSFRGMTPAEADTALSRLANVAAAEGWNAAEWRTVAKHIAEITSWQAPVLPAPGDPSPFHGTPAQG